MRSGPLAFVTAALAAGALLCAGRSAAAGVQGAAEVLAGGGYDTNMRLVLSPDAVTGTDRVASGFSRVAPTFVGALVGGGVRLEGSYAGDYRWSPDAGHLYGQEIVALMAPPAIGPLSLEISLFGGRVDATVLTEDRRHFGGGAAVLRLELGPALRTLAEYRAEVRFPFGVPVMERVRELLQLAEARVAWRPRADLELAAFGDYLRLEPLRGAESLFQRLRGGLETLVLWRRLTATAVAWAGPYDATDIPRTIYAGGLVSARFQLGAHFDAFLLGESAWPTRTGANGGGEFERLVGLVGLVAHAATRANIDRRPSGGDARPAPELDLTPAIQGRRARVRVKAPGAASVQVLGSWDDWSVPGRPLSPGRAPGIWETWLDLPAGSHRYRFLVDGRMVRPPKAPRYVVDGFGGEDGVLDVEAGTP